MPSMLTLLVAYVGVGGHGAAAIDHQVHALLAASGDVIDTSLSDAERGILVHHGDGAKAIVAKLGQDDVVAGALGRKQLTIVVYGRDGTLIDLVQLPVRKHKLSTQDLGSLGDTLGPDLAAAPTPAPAAPDATPGPAPAPRVAEADPDPEVAVHAPAPASRGARTSRVALEVGAGTRLRTYVPGPAMMKGYRSSGAPAIEVDLAITPSRFARIDATIDHTVTMATALPGGDVASSMMRWQATGGLGLARGGFEIAAIGGVGGRDFTIDAATATPDMHYVYAIAGARLALHLGRVALRAAGAYEPVFGGTDPVPMATRSGFDIGGGIDVAAGRHLVIDGDAGWQRFTIDWGKGWGSDSYPRATVSITARY